MTDHPIPRQITLHQASRSLEVAFDNGESFLLSWEYLRLFSPSIEVRGRRGKDRLLITGKKDVVLSRIEPIGRYAIKCYFDDGHHSGIYDWRYLYELGVNRERNWREHLARLEREQAGNR
jgi:DUF971 family protein